MFYIFISHLTLTIILLVIMCIANLVIDYEEIEEAEENKDMAGYEIFGETMRAYWWSFVAAFFAIVFSIFVFGLCGFHTYLISKALTT